jgi:hypothetical protein
MSDTSENWLILEVSNSVFDCVDQSTEKYEWPVPPFDCFLSLDKRLSKRIKRLFTIIYANALHDLHSQ